MTRFNSSPLTRRGGGDTHTSHVASARALVNFFFVLLLAVAAAPVFAQAGPGWLTAWGAAPLRSPIPPNIELPQPPQNLGLHGQTVRELVTVGTAGTQLRLHLDNRYGDQAVTLSAVTVARVAAGSDDALDLDSLHTVTVRGAAAIRLPAGAGLDSDALSLPLHAGDRLAISVYVRDAVQPASWHVDSRYAQHVAEGDRTRAARLGESVAAPGYDWLSRVDVWSESATGAIVALGDSITHGFRASVGASYPEQLAARLAQAGCARPVVNMGIDGNQVAAGNGDFGQGEPMTQRFAADVLAVAGARYLLLLGGINDIGEPSMAARAAGQPQPDAATLAKPIIAGLARIVASAHAHGLRVIGLTLPPFGGTQGAYSPQGEAARQQVNAWIRHEAAYDAVIDIDARLRDPAAPDRMQAALDSGDHIHPNDAGYRAMAQAVPLTLFGCGKPVATGGFTPRQDHGVAR